MKGKAITLLSAGLDSTVATALAMRDHNVVLAITFDYGQRAAAKEIAGAESLCKLWGIEHMAIELPWLRNETRTALVDRDKPLPRVGAKTVNAGAESNAKRVWVPNRNAIFVSIAASYAEARGCTAIIAGMNAEEAKTFPDNSKKFVDTTNALLKVSTRGDIQLLSPTVEMTKDDMARRFASFEIPRDSFWCCYEGGDKLCGRCESCARTIRAFRSVGLWNLIEDRFD